LITQIWVKGAIVNKLLAKFMSISKSQKKQRKKIMFLLENIVREKKRDKTHFSHVYLDVNSLCWLHLYINSSC